MAQRIGLNRLFPVLGFAEVVAGGLGWNRPPFLVVVVVFIVVVVVGLGLTVVVVVGVGVTVLEATGLKIEPSCSWLKAMPLAPLYDFWRESAEVSHAVELEWSAESALTAT